MTDSDNFDDSPDEQPYGLDIDALLQATSNSMEEAVIRLLWNTGMRSSTIAQFTPDCIDYKANVIEMPAEKTDDTIHIEIPERESEKLALLLEAISDGTFPISQRKARRCVNQVIERVDQPENMSDKITPHLFRRAFAKRLRQTGTRYLNWSFQPTVPVDSIDDLHDAIDEYLEARSAEVSSTTVRQDRSILTRFAGWIGDASSVSEPFKLQIAASSFTNAHSEDWQASTRDQYLGKLRKFERWWTKQHDGDLH